MSTVVTWFDGKQGVVAEGDNRLHLRADDHSNTYCGIKYDLRPVTHRQAKRIECWCETCHASGQAASS